MTLYFIKLDHSFWGCFQFTQKKQLKIHNFNCSLVAVLFLKWNADKNYDVSYGFSNLDQNRNCDIRQWRNLGRS